MGPSIDTSDRIHVVVTAVRSDLVGNSPTTGSLWGHPCSEVFYITSDAAVSKVKCRQISPMDIKVANWQPNISIPGPFSPVESPVILFMHGSRGKGMRPTTETEAYCLITKENVR